MWVISYIGSAAVVAVIVTDIVLWIYILYYKIKCRHVTDCENENCRNRAECDRTKMTENEKKRLLDMIAEYEDEHVRSKKI